MDNIETITKLNTIFQSVFNDPHLIIQEQMTANDIVGWDSLSHMVLITEVEEAFAIKVSLKDLNKMNNRSSPKSSVKWFKRPQSSFVLVF